MGAESSLVSSIAVPLPSRAVAFCSGVFLPPSTRYGMATVGLGGFVRAVLKTKVLLGWTCVGAWTRLTWTLVLWKAMDRWQLIGTWDRTSRLVVRLSGAAG